MIMEHTMKVYVARDKAGCIGLYRDAPTWRWNKLGTIEDWFDGCFLTYILSENFPEVTFENSPQQVEIKLVKEE